MILSNRLRTITEMVTPCGVTADIGCDHCLTLIKLIGDGITEKGIGCDIKDGPIIKARQNLEKFGFCCKIELRKGYGLSRIRQGEADAIIISGMGGHLLIDILQNGLDAAKSASQLILQPQNDIRAVREYLHKQGFKISDEIMATDADKYYTIIKAEKGAEEYDSETEYELGAVLVKKKDAVFIDYITKRAAKNEKIIKTLKSQASDNCVYKIAELERENGIIREVLECQQK